jgi:hypothetical protein
MIRNKVRTESRKEMVSKGKFEDFGQNLKNKTNTFLKM